MRRIRLIAVIMSLSVIATWLFPMLFIENNYYVHADLFEIDDVTIGIKKSISLTSAVREAGKLIDVRNPNNTKQMELGTKGAVIIFGDLSGNCNNTTTVLRTFTSILEKVADKSGLEFYFIQIKTCESNAIVETLNNNKITSVFFVHNEGATINNSDSKLNSLFNSCYNAGVEKGVVDPRYGFTTPLVVYVNQNGIVKNVTTGVQDNLSVNSNLIDLGLSIDLGKTYSINVVGKVHYSDAFDLLDQINKLRKEQGLEELSMDKELVEFANQRAAESSLLFNTSHARPDGSSFFSLSDRLIGENAACGVSTPAETLQLWINSKPHYECMMRSDIKSVGISVFENNGNYFWILDVGKDLKTKVSYSGVQNKSYYIDAVSLYVTPHTSSQSFNMKVGETKDVNIFVSPIKGIETIITIPHSWQSSDESVVIADGYTIKCVGEGVAYVSCMISGQSIGAYGVYTGITREAIDVICSQYGFDQGTKNNPVYWTYDYRNVEKTQTSLDKAATSGYTASKIPYGTTSYRSKVHNNSYGLYYGEYVFNNATQCWAFADFIGYKLTGKYPSTQWKKYKSVDEVNATGGLRVGDVIRAGGHSAMIISVSDDTFSVIECWGSSNSTSRNKIHYGKFNDKYNKLSSLSGSLDYVARYNGAVKPAVSPSEEPTEVPTVSPTNNTTATPQPLPKEVEPGVAGFTERLYTIALERGSDETGKKDWVNKVMTQGYTGSDVAKGFLYSPEFLNKNMDNSRFLEILYKVFFNRASDEGGKNDWLNRMANGWTKEQVIQGFIDSTEWANVCLSFGIPSGGKGVPNKTVEPNDQVIAFATRLYTTCLGRKADQVGLMDWATKLANMKITGTAAAHGFFFSDEFVNHNFDNAEYITRLYRTFMGREPDQGGFEYWMGRFSQGASREEVFQGFAQSKEFGEICASYGILR